MSLINVNMSSSILAGSGTVASDPGAGSGATEGTGSARPTFDGIWGSDEE